MVEHCLGMTGIAVRFCIRAPSGFGEMDIITVFETAGRGSIPLSPAKNILNTY